MERTVIAALSGAGLPDAQPNSAIRDQFDRVDIRSAAIEISLAPDATPIAGALVISTSWRR